MARKKLMDRKIQRGISLPTSLYLRIAADAEKYGRTWNEAVELILTKAFPCTPDLQISVEQTSNLHVSDADTYIAEEED